MKKNSEKVLDKQIARAQKKHAELMDEIRKIESTIRFLVDRRFNKKGPA